MPSPHEFAATGLCLDRSEFRALPVRNRSNYCPHPCYPNQYLVSAKAQSISNPKPIWVVTDLDGTLLDHDSYSYAAAKPALALLQQQQIPLILNTSKTAAEVAKWQSVFASGMPYIVENGAAVILPVECLPRFLPNVDTRNVESRHVFGKPRAEIIDALNPYLSDYQFRCFHQMAVEELMEATGLDLASATLAMQRDYSEPALWNDSEANLAELTRKLVNDGIEVIRGGRFVHFTGAGNKGEAMRWLADRQPKLPMLIALGDSDNDRPMLEACDIPVVIARKGKPPLSIQHDQQIITDAIGPAGWNEALLALLTS